MDDLGNFIGLIQTFIFRVFIYTDFKPLLAASD